MFTGKTLLIATAGAILGLYVLDNILQEIIEPAAVVPAVRVSPEYTLVTEYRA